MIFHFFFSLRQDGNGTLWPATLYLGAMMESRSLLVCFSSNASPSVPLESVDGIGLGSQAACVPSEL